MLPEHILTCCNINAMLGQAKMFGNIVGVVLLGSDTVLIGFDTALTDYHGHAGDRDTKPLTGSVSRACHQP